MRKDQQLGLDELMIVNPSSSGTEATFLGEDGTLYQVQGLGEEDDLQGLGQFFLGEDGTLVSSARLRRGQFDRARGKFRRRPGRRERPRAWSVLPRGRRCAVRGRPIARPLAWNVLNKTRYVDCYQ